MTLLRFALVLGCVFGGSVAVAAPIQLDLPEDASISASDSNPATDYSLLTGPWTVKSRAPSRALEGTRIDTAWRLRGNQQTTLQILAPLRAQIEDAGYTVLYDCATDACGGFDFRYQLDLLPEPGMHIDLGDFLYLAARKGPEYLALTVSRSSNSGFVNLTTLSAGIVDAARPDNPLQITTGASTGAEKRPIGTLLQTEGHGILGGLDFDSGSDKLKPGSYDSLAALADYLASAPDATIALVGHTDMEGALEGNIDLSKRRAAAVRARLISDYGIAPERIDAQGAGWLAPITTNLTEEGRRANRRVEVVLTSTHLD
ncbi:OmpA family protein [Thioclava sp. GXIMD4216]|uniref:OmpA family protein n=1 Tax=Thioclava sp. GXIMD4216 TaxID=3131929 RepID=UPI0030D3B529